MKRSSFETLIIGEPCFFPRNAQITFPNNPYMIKYNINGVVAEAISDSNGEVRGLIAVMHETTIQHAEETHELLLMIANFMGEFIFS